MNRFMVWCIFLLSAADAVLTDIGLRHHYIVESNVLIAFLYSKGWLPFYAVKLGLPIALLFVAPRVQPRTFTRNLLRFSLSVYLCVMVIHYLWVSAILDPSV